MPKRVAAIIIKNGKILLQYYPIWIDLDKIQTLDNLYPQEAKLKVAGEMRY